MKDLTHYFVDPIKSCDPVATNRNKVTNHIDKIVDEENSDSDSGKKRNRVKIKISLSNSKRRTCQIVDNKHDTIDKTPSPLSTSKEESSVHRDETPKKSGSLKFLDQFKNGSKEDLVLSSDKKSKTIETLGDKEMESKENIRSNSISLPPSEDKSKSNNPLEAKCDNQDSSEREEPNAFQILMTRSKPVQYASTMQLSPQDPNDTIKKTEESKEKLKQTKEKLISLADKKGYSKRKLAEVEEGEKIQKKIDNRLKLFKPDVKKEDNPSTPVLNPRSSSGSLLSYFSKTPDPQPKESPTVSTIVVKADVHAPEASVSKLSNKLKLVKNLPLRRISSTFNGQTSHMDDIQLLESENLNVTKDMSLQQNTPQQSNKPRWSLRIKLQSYKDEESCSGNTSEDEIFSPRSKSKLNKEFANKLDKMSTGKDRKSEKLLPNSKEEEAKCETILLQSKQDSKTNEKLKSDNSNDTKWIKLDPALSKKNSEEVIVVDESADCEIIEETNAKRKPAEKLAPLFKKRFKPDPATLAARRLFLQSDIKEGSSSSSRKSSDKKFNPFSPPILPFPSISHIDQLSGESKLKDPDINVKLKNMKPYVPVLNVNNYKYITNFETTEPKSLKEVERVVGENIEIALNEIEARCSEARSMWQVISSIGKQEADKVSTPKGRGKKKKLEKKKDLNKKEQNSSQNVDSTWTFKYKPMSSEQVVGNEEGAVKLKDWLNKWKTSLIKEDESSGDEFYSSDCSRSSFIGSNQVAVLLGPHGSGKSASVYAVAEELGYTVIEVNASSKRTGKKVLKELEEATKSHRIKKEHSQLPFKAISKEKETNEVKKVSENSLILLEDVDLIFDEDEGFISAAYQLASNTKRPIVMTCKDVCPHLNKMAPQQHRIYFQTPGGKRVSALLELISLAESGYKLPNDFLKDLLRPGDLRRALLQLQYLLLSGPPSQISDNSTVLKTSLWQDMQQGVYKPIIKADKIRTRKNNEKKSDVKSVNLLSTLVDHLNGLSLVSNLIQVEDPLLNISDVKLEPTLSLTEHMNSYSKLHDVSSEIAEWLRNKIIDNNNYTYDHRLSNSLSLKKQLNEGVDLALSHISPMLLDRRATALDYLPYVRTICRAENLRVDMNSKRGNRFFHYLHGLKLPSTSTKPHILAAACKMMQEKLD